MKQLLPEHLVLGFILILPLGQKAARTGYRFVKHYSGSAGHRPAGPPEWSMRLLSPVVLLLSAALFVTGLELWLFLAAQATSSLPSAHLAHGAGAAWSSESWLRGSPSRLLL
jgi:hypothetical protein